MTDLGATFEKMNIRIEAGTKTGITVNGKKYANAQDALRGSLEQLLGGATGLSATQQTVLAKTKGGTGQEILKDITFGEQFDQLVFQGREVDRVLADLNKTFVSAARQATKLGLDVGALEAAHKREADAVIAEFEARRVSLSTQLQMTAPAPGTDAIAMQFKALELEFQELGRAATELGVPIQEVTAAHQRSADALAKSIGIQQRALVTQLEAVAPTGGDAAIRSQFVALEQQFEELGRAAIELNVPLELVTAAHQRAAAELSRTIQAQQKGLSLQLRSTAPIGTEAVTVQFEALNLQMQELARSAANLNVPLEQVAIAHQQAADQLTFSIGQQQRTIAQNIALSQGDVSFGTQEFILETQMRELLDFAIKAGYTITQASQRVTQAHTQAHANLVTAWNQNVRVTLDKIAAFGGDTGLTAQLNALETQMIALKQEAGHLEIPISKVTAAYTKAVQRLRDADALLRQSFRNEVAAISPTGSELSIALAQLDVRMAELRRRAIELGEGIGQVDAAAARARAELIAQQAREAANLQRELQNMAPTGNILTRQLAEIDDQFIDLRKRAQELGVSLTLVSDAQVRARAAATREYENQQIELRRELENISPTGSQLELTLKEIDNRFIDLRTRAVELGVALSLVDSAHARARENALREFNERRAELLSRVENLGASGLTKTSPGYSQSVP